MSNSFDPAQAQHFVGPDLGPNYLQRKSSFTLLPSRFCSCEDITLDRWQLKTLILSTNVDQTLKQSL